jgi:predicted PurR-regulated permease PerM
MKSISLFKVVGVLFSLVLLLTLMTWGKTFLVPLSFATLLVMLLMPLCRTLERWGISRFWATIFALIVILMVTALLLSVIAAQISAIGQDWPQMKANAESLWDDFQRYVQTHSGIAPGEQIGYLERGARKLSDTGGRLASSFLSGFLGILTGIVLTLIFFFFLMWQRGKYRQFALKLVDQENRSEVGHVLTQISKVAQQYLIGRLISMTFLAVVYTIGFSIVGLENAALVALVAVLPTLIPYVGAFVGSFFPMAIAVLSGNYDLIVPVAAILVSAQVIDNNIIEPLAEGESLGLSPVFTIIALVLGDLVWGVAGMVLFIPMFAIIKIICDHIPALHPYSFLLANELTEPQWIRKVRAFFVKRSE